MHKQVHKHTHSHTMLADTAWTQVAATVITNNPTVICLFAGQMRSCKGADALLDLPVSPLLSFGLLRRNSSLVQAVELRSEQNLITNTRQQLKSSSSVSLASTACIKPWVTAPLEQATTDSQTAESAFERQLAALAPAYVCGDFLSLMGLYSGHQHATHCSCKKADSS